MFEVVVKNVMNELTDRLTDRTGQVFLLDTIYVSLSKLNVYPRV